MSKRYAVTAPDGSPWTVKRRNPDLGGWAWMGWPDGSPFDDPRTVYADTRRDCVARIEGSPVYAYE